MFLLYSKLSSLILPLVASQSMFSKMICVHQYLLLCTVQGSIVVELGLKAGASQELEKSDGRVYWVTAVVSEPGPNFCCPLSSVLSSFCPCELSQ